MSTPFPESAPGRVAAETTSQVAGAEAKLDQCATEPIHIPGSIQPHGLLLVLTDVLDIVQASTNTAVLLGRPAADLLGTNLLAILSPEYRGFMQALAAAPDPTQESPFRLLVENRHFEGQLHRHQGILMLELEPVANFSENLTRYHRRLQRALHEMQAARTPLELYEVIARSVSDLTGFERVMVYRFDRDWHGEVVAEQLTAEVDSYLGHHFPASDIPAQARALYTKSWLRIIPDASYTPVPIEPVCHPATQRPLDLSFAGLRSVSPIHLEYLRNMNVGASMSISLIVEGQLWGLVACHHRTAHPLPPSVRAACELLGQIASREVATEQERRSLAERAEVNRIQTGFFEIIAREENTADALLRFTPSLLEFMRAGGAAICLGGQCNLVGQTPSRTEVAALLAWLKTQFNDEGLFTTDRLPALFPEAGIYQVVSAGVLAVRLSRVDEQYLVWFRPEVATTVTWAGNPAKPMDDRRIHPRKSFAAWQETVAGRSLPWHEAEQRGALELRLALNALVIRRTERLLSLNGELERKNTDLNSFAYIASHDLKEPVRGIHHFSKFLLEDHAAELGVEGLRKVNTIASLASHTNDLLAALAHFSQLGRMELQPRETSLQKLMDEVLIALGLSLREHHAQVERSRPLPTITCDPVLVREVFVNLIANAIKYNDHADKRVEISYLDPPAGEEARGPVFYVRDNGIGIRDRNLGLVFQMFRRLSKDKYGPGTGAGLAIVKSIIERHGGRIWIDSTYGEGSTFYFTLK